MRNPSQEIYLDNSATTRPCDAAVQAMVASMQDCYCNPSALYGKAVEAERGMRAARETIVASLQADAQHVIFTSGGTESDNLAILGYLSSARQKGIVLYSAAEHPAVKNACKEAAALHGHTAQEIPIDSQGTLDLQALRTMLNDQVRLICVMQVCNETGVVMPIEEVVALRDELTPKAAIHVDGVQGYMRIPFSMKTLAVQSYAVSAHKVHGPKGVGALVVRDGHRLHPQMVGGGQQDNLRSGTENTAGIAGFAAAVQAYPDFAKTHKMLWEMKHLAMDMLQDAIPLAEVLGVQGEQSAPHILYVALPPVRAETMVHALEAEGIMVGTGSACSSHKHRRSEVLTGMGVQPAKIDSSIRLSFSITNTLDEVQYAMEQLIKQYQVLARFTRR